MGFRIRPKLWNAVLIPSISTVRPPSSFQSLRILLRAAAFLLITHYQRILDYIKPQYVHVMVNGRIARSGGPELALELESTGYESFRGETAGV